MLPQYITAIHRTIADTAANLAVSGASSPAPATKVHQTAVKYNAFAPASIASPIFQ